MAGKSGRKANGEGNIRQRKNGLWEARVTLPDGRGKSLYGKTRQEVARALTALLHARDQGLPVGLDGRQTVKQYLTSWLEMVRPTIKPKTYRGYEYTCRCHLIPGIGKAHLVKLTPQQVQTLWAHLLEEELSSTSVNHFHAVLHKALEDAQRLGLVMRNVCDLVDPPRIADREMHVLDEAQANHLLETARGDRLEALYRLALATGMREGELLGLHWREVDLERRQLQVVCQLEKAPHEPPVFTSPKTKRSRRRIRLPLAVVDALRQHRALQSEERLALGPAWEDMGLVFCNTVGQPLDPTNLLRRQFYPLLKRAGLPIIHFHDLRHTAATLFLLRGLNPKIVSELLGHASISITLDIYSHVLPDMQDQAAEMMDAIMGYIDLSEAPILAGMGTRMGKDQ